MSMLVSSAAPFDSMSFATVATTQGPLATSCAASTSAENFGATTPIQNTTSALSRARFYSSNTRRVWCQSPKPEYKLETQRVNLPARCIPLVRPGVDLIVLPGDHVPTREFFAFCKAVLGVQDEQAIWTTGSHFNMDDDMDTNVVSKLQSLLVNSSTPDHKSNWEFVPYCPTKNFQRWSSVLFANVSESCTVSIFGEGRAWVDRFGDKGILHRHIETPDQPSVIETIDASIPVAKGYVCDNVDQLILAFDRLTQHEACEHVVIKPLAGATGQGIILKPTKEQLLSYDFPIGAVALEEFLKLDMAPDGTSVSPALHYMEGHVLGGRTMVDQIMDGTRFTGWRTTCTSTEFQQQSLDVMNKFIQFTDPQGPGGVDFLSVNGKPVLVDINTGRFNGAHTPKLFQQLYAPESELYCWKCAPPATLTVFDFWERLKARGAAFVPGVSTSGVFPLLFLRGLSGLFVVFGNQCGQVHELQQIALECLKA